METKKRKADLQLTADHVNEHESAQTVPIEGTST